MRYTIRTHDAGYTEYFEFKGKTYRKEHWGSASMTECEDLDFCEQLEANGVDDEEVLDKVFDIIDNTLIGFDLLEIADLEWD